VAPLSQGVGVDNATALADIARKLRDVLQKDGTPSNLTESSWVAAFNVVEMLTDIRRKHPDTPIHSDEMKVVDRFPNLFIYAKPQI